MMAAITADALPPPRDPGAPELDDRSLARLLAELEGDETLPPEPRDPLELPPAAAPGPPPAADEPVGRPDGRGGQPKSPPARYPRPSPEGPVIPSPYGAHRPPVRRRGERAPTLTGLGPLTRGRLGSRLFTLVFVAIFVMIVVQTLISLLATGH